MILVFNAALAVDFVIVGTDIAEDVRDGRR